MRTSIMSSKGLFYLAFLLLPVAAKAQLIEQPKASFELCFQSSSGTNASAVTYDPASNRYFSCIAGNSVFPLEVFDGKGQNIYQTECGSDMRGLWWNPKTKQLEGNGYSSVGIVGLLLDGSGFPSLGNTTIFDGTSHQPEGNSCGVYDGKKVIWYYSSGSFYMYSRKSGNSMKSIMLSGDVNLESINTTSMIYTGIKGMELGLLDFEAKKVLLFNKKTGALSAEIKLPSSAVTNYSFRFAFANKHVFLYDTESRCWTAYQITQ
jgi:hypothetical protein